MSLLKTYNSIGSQMPTTYFELIINIESKVSPPSKLKQNGRKQHQDYQIQWIKDKMRYVVRKVIIKGGTDWLWYHPKGHCLKTV